MLTRRNLILVAAFSIFACTLLLTFQRLSSLCPGPFCSVAGSLVSTEQKQHHESWSGTGTNGEPAHITASPVAAAPVATVTVTMPPTEDAANESLQTAPDKKPGCENFPDLSNIFVVLKTGASEAYNRVPTHLMTNLKCVPNYEIWSDMEQTIAGQKVLDSLTQVLPEVKAHKDFEIYRHQAKCPTDQEDCNKDYETASKGWSLDKYKNIHIAEANWAQHPEFDWYVYIDADTYVFWPTMAEWFARLDPKKPAYFGSVALLNGFPFGHGGSGYTVSNAAMKMMFDHKDKVANKYDQKATTTCCGDYLFAYAVKEETGLDVQNMHPTVNGDKAYTMPFYAGQWCQPIITTHHVSSEEVNELHEFERHRDFKSPVRIKDLFDGLIQPKLRDEEEDWDNQSEDVYYFDKESDKFSDRELERLKKGDYNDAEKEAHHSFEHCRAACESIPTCVQYRFGNKRCTTSTAVRFGKPTTIKKEDGSQKSGWMVQRINEFIEQHKDCGEVKFPELRKNEAE